MPKYSKTVRAFLAEDGSKWGIVDALIAEMPGHCSASELGECRQYLAQHGVEKAVKTIEGYRVVGQFVEEATARQASTLRSQSVSTVKEFSMRGAAQEYAVAAIADFQAESGQDRMPQSVVRTMFGQPRPTRLSTDPEQWTAAQWSAFDKIAIAAAHTVLTALNVWQRGLYKPSVEALAQLALIKPQDLDAELRQLLGAND